MNWKEIKTKDDLPKTFGWYAAALNPVNYDDIKDTPSVMNSWRKSFGFSKVWYNDSTKDFFEPNSHGYGNDLVTKRVTHWDELPDVPDLI